MFYAKVLPPIPVCIGFYDKKLRDEWVQVQNKKRRERLDDMWRGLGLSEEQLNILRREYPLKDDFVAITAKEAMKLYGEKDAWGDRKIRVHRVLHSLDDRW